MLKHLSETYGVPLPALIGLSIAGLIGFWVCIGIGIYAWLVEHCPELPWGWAAVLGVVGPPVFMLGVAIVGAIHDKCSGAAAGRSGRKIS